MLHRSRMLNRSNSIHPTMYALTSGAKHQEFGVDSLNVSCAREGAGSKVSRHVAVAD